MEELLSTLKVYEIELNEDEDKMKGKFIALKAQNASKRSSSKASKLRNLVKKPLKKKDLIRMSSPLSQGKSAPCGKTKEDPNGKITLEGTPRKSKTQVCKKLGDFNSECPRLEKKKENKKLFFKKGLMKTWEDLDLSFSEVENEEANICLMDNTTSEEEDDDEEVIFNYLIHLQKAYQNLSNSSTLSIGYKDLKKKFSKLSKEFNSLDKENDLLKKENEKVNEQLQRKVIDFRKSLAKFVNGSKSMKNSLKNKRHSYEKSSIGYDKKKDLKKDKSTSHSLNCGRFRHLSYDCRYYPKGSFKPFKTNKKRPKRI
ncbi:hypothetical protein CR513_05383, partial [Mucuna pruriens]